MTDRFYGHQMNFSIVRVDELNFGVCTLTHTVDTIDTVKKNRWVRGVGTSEDASSGGFSLSFQIYTEVIQESYSVFVVRQTHKK